MHLHVINFKPKNNIILTICYCQKNLIFLLFYKKFPENYNYVLFIF